MGSAIRLTNLSAYDKMKMIMATGSRNDAPPMIVVLTNSLKVSFQPNSAIEAEIEQSRPFTPSRVGSRQGARKQDFGRGGGRRKSTPTLGWLRSELARSLLLALFHASGCAAPMATHSKRSR